jgi:hypothetical protein
MFNKFYKWIAATPPRSSWKRNNSRKIPIVGEQGEMEVGLSKERNSAGGSSIASCYLASSPQG